MNYVRFLVAAFAFLPALAWAGQLSLDATVDSNQVAQGDNFTLTLTLTSDSNISGDDEPRLPTLDGFELLNKWTQSEASSIFDNGKFMFVRKQIYKYTLSPQKTGTLHIGSAQMRVNGQNLSTQPITITVTAGEGGGSSSNVAQGRSQKAQRNRQNQNNSQNPFGDDDDDDEDLFTQLLKRRGFLPDGNGGVKSRLNTNKTDAFFIQVEANKRKVYVGEEIVVSWYLYTRGAIQAFDALKYPDLKGFWKEDLEMASRLNFQTEIVNGIPYQKALLVSYALFPLSAGRKTIDSYKAKATVIEMDSAMSMFGLGHPYSYTKSSEELPIEVLPLPAEGRPASFSGAVGHFNVTGSLSSAQAKVNQPVSLKIRFQGQGNVKNIDLPPLDNLPKNLEVYDTKKDAKFDRSGEGYKEFEVLLIPRSQGKVTIPPIEVSYFDPKAVKYVTTKTPSFTLDVLPGNGAAPDNFSAPLAQSEPQKSGAPARGVRYLKTASSFELPAKAQKIGWLALFGMVYGFFGVRILKVTSGRNLDQRSAVKKRVKLKLKTAQAKLKSGDWRGVGIESSNAVLSTLGEVTGAGGGSLTAEELLGLLPSATPKLKEDVRNFLSRCELVSFAPKEIAESAGKGGAKNVQALIGDAEKIISALFELAGREKSA